MFSREGRGVGYWIHEIKKRKKEKQRKKNQRHGLLLLVLPRIFPLFNFISIFQVWWCASHLALTSRISYFTSRPKKKYDNQFACSNLSLKRSRDLNFKRKKTQKNVINLKNVVQSVSGKSVRKRRHCSSNLQT